MISFGRVLKSPMQDERWVGKTVVGGMFKLVPLISFVAMIMAAALASRAGGHWVAGAMLGVAVTVSSVVFAASPLLSFFPFGYIIARARGVYAGGGEELPEWSGWKKLFVDGAAYFLVYFVYMLVPSLLLIWSVVFPAGGAGGAFIRYLSAVLAFILALAAAFLLPMGLCNFVVKGKLGAAFDFNAIIEKIKIVGQDYVAAFAASVGIFLVIYIASLFLGVLVVGWIVFPFLMFYAFLALAGLFMELYPADEAGEESEEEVLEPEILG